MTVCKGAGVQPVTVAIDAVLFDLGRVLLDIDMSRIHRRWAQLAGLSDDHFEPGHTAAFMAHDVFHRHERGEISDADFFTHSRHALGLGLDDAQMLEGWNAIFIGEMAGIREVIDDLKGLRPLYVFSNTNAAHHAFWSERYADLLAPFDKIYVSNLLGVRKPEAAAFNAVVADIGVPGERVLFFDDAAANVDGARAAGLQAAHTVTTADIIRELERAGLRAER